MRICTRSVRIGSTVHQVWWRGLLKTSREGGRQRHRDGGTEAERAESTQTRAPMSSKQDYPSHQSPNFLLLTVCLLKAPPFPVALQDGVFVEHFISASSSGET